jgi:hypothetical protein
MKTNNVNGPLKMAGNPPALFGNGEPCHQAIAIESFSEA